MALPLDAGNVINVARATADPIFAKDAWEMKKRNSSLPIFAKDAWEVEKRETSDIFAENAWERDSEHNGLKNHKHANVRRSDETADGDRIFAKVAWENEKRDDAIFAKDQWDTVTKTVSASHSKRTNGSEAIFAKDAWDSQ